MCVIYTETRINGQQAHVDKTISENSTETAYSLKVISRATQVLSYATLSLLHGLDFWYTRVWLLKHAEEVVRAESTPSDQAKGGFSVECESQDFSIESFIVSSYGPSYNFENSHRRLFLVNINLLDYYTLVLS